MRCMFSRCIAVVVIVAGLLLLSPPALAVSMFAGVSTLACAPNGTCNGGANQGFAGADFNNGMGNVAAASAQANIGTLGVRATALGDFTTAAASAGWSDVIQVTSTSLPPGTPVVIHPTISVASTLTQHGDGQGTLGWYLREVIAGTAVYLIAVNLPGVPDTSSDLHVQTGGGLLLEGGQEVSVESLPNSQDPSDPSSVDYNSSDTARFFLDAMTPGVTLVSSSGHDFSAPVPEPNSLALVASGALLLALLLGRRDRSARDAGTAHIG